ncbi:oligo-1,6-glucosidase [Hypnocyclicus thermotrophus]|uniref:Oligo-1,6-glucosidase n=1 Tax=Hypnocyclicus thermotrophus TaxID=1627895 RepID=A0AA46DY43_9FUSO|nr:alpha-glucosidase [Hypnocyclicus thermotrophus]TDT69713.1 oligo-1,6-glucosidase [Hypnocyclicus thermotrophus]
MERKWWKESIVYQIYPRSFKDTTGNGIGDLKGIIEKVDYLKELGVDIIWLNPVYKSPNDDNGYDISDYYSIMDEFGTMEDWEKLLNELHKRDMKLIMDLVVNHTSDEHIWFLESKKSKDNQYRDYYFWKKGKDGKEPNNWVSVFGGSAWQYDETTDEYYLHIFSKKQPDLNWENPKVRKDIYKMMKWWLDKGIDGFRMDVINFISKNTDFPSVSTNEKYGWGGEYFMNGPRVNEFFKEMNKEVLSNYNIMTVGECPGATPEHASSYANIDGSKLNMIFTFEHVSLDHGPYGKFDIKPLKLKDLKENINKWQIELYNKAWNSLYLMNHDQPRAVSRFGDDKKYRVESAKMLITFTMTLCGTPYIYQGEEIGMTNISFDSIEKYRDLETLNYYNEALNNGADKNKLMKAIHYMSRDNSRTPMQWDNTKNAGFSNADTTWINVNPNYTKINVKEALNDENSILNYYKKMIKIRKSNLTLIYGEHIPFMNDNENIFAYIKKYENQLYIVYLNFSKNKQSIILPENITKENLTLIISNYKNNDFFNLKPYEARVYKVSQN